jgi:hypothetical protein
MPAGDLGQLIDAMDAVGPWLETDWWSRPQEEKETKDITRELQADLSAAETMRLTQGRRAGVAERALRERFAGASHTWRGRDG